MSFAQEAANLKDQVLAYLQLELPPKSIKELKQIDCDLLSCPELGTDFTSKNENKEGLYIAILANLMYYYSLYMINEKCDELQVKKLDLYKNEIC